MKSLTRQMKSYNQLHIFIIGPTYITEISSSGIVPEVMKCGMLYVKVRYGMNNSS